MGVANGWRLDLSRPEHCYMLGVVLGDGTVLDDGFSVAVGRPDTDFSEVLNRTIESCGWRAVVKDYPNANALSVVVWSRSLARDFRQFKLKPTDESRLICASSPWDFPIQPDHPSHLIAGLIDTDGCVGKTQTTISQRDHGGIEQVLHHLDKLGISHKVDSCWVAGGPQKIVRIHGRVNLVKISSLPLRHPRKIQAAQSYLDSVGPGKRRHTSPVFIDPVAILKVWGETESVRRTSVRTGLCRATVNRKLREAVQVPVLYGPQGTGTHLVVNESKKLWSLVKRLTAACKGSSSSADDFLCAAIEAELPKWEK